MNDPTKTEVELETEPYFDPAIMLTADVQDEVFDDSFIYFYVLSLDWFFCKHYGMHPYLVAASGLFTVERWLIIRILVSQYGINEILNQFDLNFYVETVSYLESQALITSGESANLLSVLPPSS